MQVAVLGLGEAGSQYAKAFAAHGCAVTSYDPREIATDSKIQRAASVREAVRNADLVLSLTTASPSVGVALEASGAMKPEALYIDLNAASPTMKQEVAAALGDQVKTVDGAIIGSVQRYGDKVHVLLSGDHSAEAESLLNVIEAQAEAIGGDVGDASRRKLLRSVFMKGLGALVTEAITVGKESGEEEWVRGQIASELDGGEETVDRLFNGTRTHAKRRASELEASLDLIQGYPGRWPVTKAAHEVHVGLANSDSAQLVAELRRIPTSALGDAGDRLGFLDSTVRPVWGSTPLAGRAFTVQTRPGDNEGIHRALSFANPGDVLVVAGGGHTERALIGELIAERAKAIGIAGMIIDGAVRDVTSITELKFPVWAKATSAAGPYKTGPYRLGESVSVAGAVCEHGDYVVADSDGVIVVPARSAGTMIRASRAVLDHEEERKVQIRSEQPS